MGTSPERSGLLRLAGRPAREPVFFFDVALDLLKRHSGIVDCGWALCPSGALVYEALTQPHTGLFASHTALHRLAGLSHCLTLVYRPLTLPHTGLSASHSGGRQKKKAGRGTCSTSRWATSGVIIRGEGSPSVH